MSTTLLGTRRIDYALDSLEGITSSDHASEVDPRRAGLSADALESIWQAVESLYGTRIYPALTFCLRRRGHVLLNRSIGYASGGGPGETPGADARLAAPDTPVCLFSASKAIIALLIHKLAEEGGIDLDQRVAHYVPEFAQSGKGRTTISQVLSHQGGFPTFDVDPDVMSPDVLADWDQCIRLICNAPGNPRDRHMAYHAITGGFILGEIIARVTGAPMVEYLDSRLRKPLGMRYFTYGLDGRSRSRVAINYVAGQPVRFPVSVWAKTALAVPFGEVVDVSNQGYFMDAVIPAGNLYATAEELSRFYQMLLDGGRYQDKRLFKADTIARAVRPATRLGFDWTLKIPMRYSEGLMLGATPAGLYGPMSGQAFGHLGFMSILGWADPARDISVGLLTTGKAILGGHLLTLARTLTTINWQCRTS